MHHIEPLLHQVGFTAVRFCRCNPGKQPQKHMQVSTLSAPKTRQPCRHQQFRVSFCCFSRKNLSPTRRWTPALQNSWKILIPVQEAGNKILDKRVTKPRNPFSFPQFSRVKIKIVSCTFCKCTCHHLRSISTFVSLLCTCRAIKCVVSSKHCSGYFHTIWEGQLRGKLMLLSQISDWKVIRNRGGVIFHSYTVRRKIFAFPLPLPSPIFTRINNLTRARINCSLTSFLFSDT